MRFFHHLDFLRALDEIKRVLRPHGKMIFTEPLDNNPVGKVVRALTPHARTDDEQPLRWKEMAEIKNDLKQHSIMNSSYQCR